MANKAIINRRHKGRIWGLVFLKSDELYSFSWEKKEDREDLPHSAKAAGFANTIANIAGTVNHSDPNRKHSDNVVTAR